jgi:hypothetical protein
MTAAIGVNDLGSRVGESHHRARLTQHDVDLIRDLHEDYGLGYGRLAAKFGVCKETIARVCRYETWAQAPTRWRRV